MSEKDPSPSSTAQVEEDADAAEAARWAHVRDPLVRTLLAAALAHEDELPEFREVIKRGGVGAIAIADDHTLGRKVAVKSLRPEAYDDPVLVRGFLREAHVIGQLEHPNIVPIHRLAMSADDGVFFSMSLIDGHTLADFLAAHRELDYDDLFRFLAIIDKVCDALALAHSRGVVHCDIKPANIMIGEFGQVYLMDWGLAQLLPDDGGGDDDDDDDDDGDDDRVRDTLPELPAELSAGMVYGTPAYMAPEQAGGDPVDRRVDVFAVGALIYHFITGRPPFMAKTIDLSARKARNYALVPLDENAHGGLLPASLFAVTRKAMARDPDERYQTIEELQSALLRLVRGQGAFPTVVLDKGAVVIRQGDVGDAAYIVVDGELEVYKESDGKRQKLRRLGKGDVFGETAIFASVPRTASVVALSEVTLVRITDDVVQSELEAMKPWMAAFVRILAQRFHESEGRPERPARRWWRRR